MIKPQQGEAHVTPEDPTGPFPIPGHQAHAVEH